MAIGDFSPSALLNIQLKAEQMWADSRLAADYKANAQTAVALKQNSTATFEDLKDPNRERVVRVSFINPCAVAVQDCESNCDINGNELSVGSKDYTLDLCKEVVFNVDAEKMRTNTYSPEEVAAKALSFALKSLDEWWSQQALVKLHAFAGVNTFPAPYTYATGTTTVPAASYGVQMIANLLYQAMMNKMTNPFYIDNGGLWVPYTNARLNANNLDGAGDAARIKQLNMYFDSWNFGPAGITETDFAVSSSAVAFVTKTRNPDTPTVIGGSVQQTRYTVPSTVIPGVRYDVYYTLKCITVNGQAHLVHSWKIQTLGGIFLNPEGCPVVVGGTTYTPTGVLGYTKGA
jgi:hypothetical protein